MIHESSIHAGYLGRVAGRGAHGVIVCRYQPPPPPNPPTERHLDWTSDVSLRNQSSMKYLLLTFGQQ